MLTLEEFNTHASAAHTAVRNIDNFSIRDDLKNNMKQQVIDSFIDFIDSY